jgi:hypothetical protein
MNFSNFRGVVLDAVCELMYNLVRRLEPAITRRSGPNGTQRKRVSIFDNLTL